MYCQKVVSLIDTNLNSQIIAGIFAEDFPHDKRIRLKCTR